MTSTFGDGGLTEVQCHADEDDQAKPGVEVGDEVDNGNDNVGNGWEDAEHNVAAGGGRIKGGFGPTLRMKLQLDWDFKGPNVHASSFFVFYDHY